MTRALRCLAGLSLVLVATACASTMPESDYYLLVLTSPAVRDAPAVDARLKINELSVDPGYADTRMVYRLTEQRLRYYHYHEWVTNPGRLVTGALHHYLEESGAFADVIEGMRPSPDLLLDGRVRAIEEIDRDKRPFEAHIAVELKLRRADTGAVLWQELIDAREAVEDGKPDAVAAAMGRALAGGMAKVLPAMVEAARRSLAERALPEAQPADPKAPGSAAAVEGTLSVPRTEVRE